MEKITAKSKKRIIELFTPGQSRQAAPRGMTVRRLMGHRKYERLRAAFMFAVIEGEHNVCVWNLEHLGFDYYG